MDPLLPRQPPVDPGPEASVGYVDPLLEREPLETRWSVRAAQWRARELAEAVFGDVVATRLVGPSPLGPFRGLLHLDVPFFDLDVHQAREARFAACAAVDPLLSRVPLVFVFRPLEDTAGR